MPVALGTLVLLWMAAVGTAPGREDEDLDRIPDSAEGTTPAPARAAPEATPPPSHRRVHARFYVEDALSGAIRREPIVPFPAPPPYRWQNRTSADLVAGWLATSSLELTVSDRADLVAQEAQAWRSRRTARNELREAYASWQPRARAYVEVGRINVRNGVALGYNPTDFFRPRTLVGQTSLDPSVLSRNRLGTLMVRVQAIGERGAVSLLYAPKLFSPTSIADDRWGVNPRLDATNAAHRVLASASGNLGDLSVQALGYLEERRSRLGVALTRPLGGSVVAYAEATVGHEANLATRAIEYGQQTGTLPPGVPPPIPTDLSLAWRSDVAAGASWTLAARLTLNLEYHLHQSALGAGDWRRWFAAGGSTPLLAPELWYIRGYAADQMEPASQHNAFVRIAWPEAILSVLDLDAFAFVSLRDGSTLTQLTARYAISDRWSLTISLSGNLGTAHSERGSLPQASSAIAEIACFL